MTTRRRYDVDWDDDEIERGGSPPPGWYGACVFEVNENFENGSIKVVYEITTPTEFAKQRVFDTLWSPQNAKDEASEKRTLQRQLMIAQRLGIIPPPEERQGGFEVEWDEAVGREVFLRVTLRDGFLQPEYAGVYGADDARVPEEVRQGHPAPLTVKPLVVKDEK